jgi:phospholipase C
LFGQLEGQLTGKETNPLPNGKQDHIDMNPSLVPNCDPDHSFTGTNHKLFGMDLDYSKASMSGFAEWELYKWNHTEANHYCDVLSGYPPSSIPVAKWLAEEYSLFDGYFSAFPGATWPNRWV